MGVTESFIGEVSGVCGTISQLGCMAIGGITVIRGEFTVGELIAAIQLLNSVFCPISNVSQLTAVINASKPIREKMEKNEPIIRAFNHSFILV